MWTKSHSIVTKEVSKEQMWKLFTDVNNWNKWDEGIEFAKMEGSFEKGNYFTLRPKGGPNVRVELLETKENEMFLDQTKFPLATMFDEHVFEETVDGLKITNTLTVKGILSFVWVKLVAGKIAAALPTEMQRQIEYAKTL